MLIAACSSFALVWSINRRAATIEETIIAQEKQVGEALMKHDQAAFKNLVSADAIAVGPRGAVKVSDIMGELFSPDYKSEGFAMEATQVKMMDKDAYVITYKGTGTESYKGESHNVTAYESTLWVKQGNKWMATFHQTTPVMPMGQDGQQ